MIVPGTRVQFTESEKAKFIDHFDRTIEDDLLEHVEREDRLLTWQQAYDSEPEQAKKMFPWPGASNLVIPIISIAADSIAARVLNTIFGVDPLWTINPLRKETEPLAKPVERYLDWSRKVEFDFYQEVHTCCQEVIKFGWSFLKFGWEVFTNVEYSTDENGEIVQSHSLTRRPVIYHVLTQDVIPQAGVEDERQAEYITQRVRLTDNQMYQRRYDHIYEFEDKLLNQKEDLSKSHEMLQSSRDQSAPSKEPLNTIYERSIDWPYGPDNLPTSIIATFHKESKTLLRAMYNPMAWRPLLKISFITREGRMEGFGIAKRLWALQQSISSIHNQRLDNGTIANTRFFVGRKSVVRTDTKIWPGRFLGVPDPERDIKSFQLGDIYPSMREIEMSELAYAERASGVSDYQLGRESNVAGSSATATGTLALIQEGNRRFDLNIRDIRSSLSEAGRRLLDLNQRFRPRGAAYFVQGEDGAWTEQALSLPQGFSTSHLSVELTASTSTINKQVEKQELIALFGIQKQYYDSINQVGMLMMNPQVPPEYKEVLMKEALGFRYTMQRIAQSFDIKSIDTIAPGLVQESMNESGAGNGADAQGPPSESPGMPSGDSPNGRMAPLQGLSGATDATGL